MKFVVKDDVLSWSEERRLYRLSSRLFRYFNEIVSIEWNLSREGRGHRAACKVHSKSGYYRVQVVSDDLAAATLQALDKIVRQRRRRKVILKTRRRQPTLVGREAALGLAA